MKRAQIATLLLFVSFTAGQSQTIKPERRPTARRFDEFTIGIGDPRLRVFRNYDEQARELKGRLLRFARQVRKEGARAYIIGYSPRVLEWEIYNRSIGEMRAGEAKEKFPVWGFDNGRITTVDGGFREVAATELWIVPRGAPPPLPTPTVKKEDVAYCPSVRIAVVPYIPRPNSPIEFKAFVEVNDKKIQPTFAWKVSQGKITNGQGTDTIAVELPAGAAGEVTAKVEVGGYSLDCPIGAIVATNSTTVGVNHYKYDEFVKLQCEDEMARLDNLAISLHGDPSLQAHIVMFGGRDSYGNEALARAARMKGYVVQNRMIDSSRVLMIDGGYRDELSGELWLSPKGMKPPDVKPTVDKRYVKIRGQMKIVEAPCSYE